MATIACQLGLTGGVLLKNRRDKVADGFELMTVCPGQEKRDIIAQTSRERIVRCHTHRLSQGPSLGYSSPQKMCPDIRPSPRCAARVPEPKNETVARAPGLASPCKMK